MEDWKQNPQDYQKDSEGNFVLKKDGTPKKRPGQKKGGQYNFHSETKAKIASRRKIADKKREVKKLEAKLGTKKQSLKATTEVANKLDGKLGISKKVPAILQESDLDYLPESTKQQLIDNEANIVFKPHPGPQTDFLASSEKEVLYGGAAGGGKSYAMLMDPLRYIGERDHRALILRKTLPELSELIDKSREFYPLAYPGARYLEAKKTWNFPSGAKVQFGYCERDSDVYQYQGQAYSWIGFDELTHLATSFAWDYMRSRLRTTNPNIETYMRATTNPGGVGHAWVKKRFIDEAPPNTTFYDHSGHISRRFIPAKLSDNPSLYDDGQYQKLLESMDPIQRARLLEGDWDINEGAAFTEFSRKVHVIPPMDIPPHWARFKAIDYGYRAPSCCLWFAVDPSDGTLIVYRELYEKGLTGEALGERIHDLELPELITPTGVLDGAAWNNTGTHGPTVGEALVKAGHKLRRADKNRIAGKIQVHERFKLNEKSGRPKVQIFSGCDNLIREISSIPVDPTNREDVDTHAEDHAYDAFRYGVMSRPRMDDPFLRMQKFKQDRVMPSDGGFGY